MPIMTRQAFLDNYKEECKGYPSKGWNDNFSNVLYGYLEEKGLLKKIIYRKITDYVQENFYVSGTGIYDKHNNLIGSIGKTESTLPYHETLKRNR